MQRCPRCKSDALEEHTIRYSQEFEGTFYIIEHVPAGICGQCGEVVLAESTAEKIQRVIWSGAKPQRTETVPVYEIA
jgi:YgiT-type zinc finger domain-containing protein